MPEGAYLVRQRHGSAGLYWSYPIDRDEIEAFFVEAAENEHYEETAIEIYGPLEIDLSNGLPSESDGKLL